MASLAAFLLQVLTVLGVGSAAQSPEAQHFSLGDMAAAPQSQQFTLEMVRALDHIERLRLANAALEAAQKNPILPKRLLLDVTQGVREPAHWGKKEWGTLGLGALAVATISIFDDDIRELLGGGDEGDPIYDVRPLGRAPGLVLVATTWLIGRTTHHHALQRVSSDALEAALLAGLTTAVLKKVAGRARPIHEQGSSAWRVGEESFPSGDVTTAFAIATVFARHSKKAWIDALAWSYAGLISLERIRLDAHWASDVLAGALIGVAVGRWVVRRNGPLQRLTLSPMIGLRQWGLSGSYRFGD